MYDKKEFPILVQLAPTDNDKEVTLQARLAALEAENKRLREALNTISLVDNENRLHDGLMQQIAREALQPAEGAGE